MLDFKEKGLYDSRSKDMKEFLELVLVTKEERNKEIKNEELEDELMEEFSDDEIDDFFTKQVNEGSAFDPASLNEDLDETKEEFQEVEEEDTIFKPLSELGTPYETDNVWKDLIISPYYLFYYMFRSLNRRFRDKTNWNLFLNSLWKVSGVTSVFALIMVFFVGDVRFLFSMNVLAVVSVIMFIISFSLVKLIKMDGILDSLRHVDLHGERKIEEELDNFIVFDNEDEEEVIIIGEEDEITEVTSEGPLGNPLFDDNEEDEYDEVEEDLAEFGMDSMTPTEEVNTYEPSIPYSPIDVNVDIDMYLNQLKDIYNRNTKYEGIYINKREDLVKSFSDYLISNDKKFGSWEIIPDYSNEFNNLLYTFYLALVKIDNRMKNKESEDNKIYVNSLTQNPLMYKLEIELPEYITVDKLKRSKSDIEDTLKSSDSDTEVSVLLSAYRQGIVVKFFKPARGLVSLGDILRYRNEDTNEPQAYEHFFNEKMGLPILLGLRGNEHPTVIDLADNTSGVIAGESGSGKSWGTFLLLLNLIISNSYNDLNFVIMDRKKAVFWRELARLPHTLGYHTEVKDYFDILQELKEEMEYRKELLQKVDKENWGQLRESLKRSGNYDDLQAFPWLVVIIDEMTNTMVEIRDIAGEKNKHIEERFIGDLKTLIQEGRSLGIKLISIGQRTIDESIPKSIMMNSKFKLFFSLGLSDYNKGMNESDLKKVNLPKQKGQALMVDEKYTFPVLLRTLTLGGVNDDQITNLIRILAFEWNRRSKGKDLTMPSKLKFTYNRDKIRQQVFEDMDNGKLFLGGKDSEGDLSNIANLIRNRQDITSEDELMPLSDFKIEKEDSNGNIIEEHYEDEDDNISNELVNSKNIHPEKRSVKITTNKASSMVERDLDRLRNDNNEQDLYNGSSSEVDSLVRNVKSKKSIVTQNLGKKKKSNSVDEMKNIRAERMRKLRENMLKNRIVEDTDNKPETDVEREVYIESTPLKKEVRVDRREGLTVEQYIRKYGTGSVTKGMKKHVIIEIFSQEEIRRALNNIKIAESGDEYII